MSRNPLARVPKLARDFPKDTLKVVSPASIESRESYEARMAAAKRFYDEFVKDHPHRFKKSEIKERIRQIDRIQKAREKGRKDDIGRWVADIDQLEEIHHEMLWQAFFAHIEEEYGHEAKCRAFFQYVLDYHGEQALETLLSKQLSLPPPSMHPLEAKHKPPPS